MTPHIVSFTRKFETAHRFLNSCEDSCMSPHGHTWWVTWKYKIPNPIDKKTGFFLPYSDLKSNFTELLKNSIDHAILLNEDDPLVEDLLKVHPKCRMVLFPCDPTTEALAYQFLKHIIAYAWEYATEDWEYAIKIQETPVNAVEIDFVTKENFKGLSEIQGK